MFEKVKLILIPQLIKMVIVLITATCKVRWHGREQLDEFIQSSDKACIISGWHECSTIATWVLRYRGIVGMVSASRDGNYISRFAELFGNETVRGSTSSGSSRVTRTILKHLKKKKSIAITPDGPRGPKHQLQNGVLWLSALGKVPIFPVHVEASKQWVFDSWDDHKIPKPFSTIYVGVGEAYYASRDALNENAQTVIDEFEQRMMFNTNQIKSQTRA